MISIGRGPSRYRLIQLHDNCGAAMSTSPCIANAESLAAKERNDKITTSKKEFDTDIDRELATDT